MRRSAIIILILLTLAFTCASDIHAFRNEKSGYNGFEWGDSYDKYLKTSTKKLKKKDNVYYGAKIRGVDVDVGYEFYKDKLYGVLITFPEKKRKEIITHFKSLHGKPSLKRGKNLYWVGGKTKISLRKENVKIVSIEMEKEYIRDVVVKKKKKKSSK